MLIRVLSDIHSNFQALEAVLSDPPGADSDVTLCLGDIVGYGADPSKCIESVRRECNLIVCGNHDAGVSGRVTLDRYNWEGATVIRWTKSVLGPEEIKWLDLLPYFAEFENFFLCHSYPPDPASWIYVLRQNQALASMEARNGMISIIGHTHLPGCWMEDGNYTEASTGDFSRVRLVNVGSVGQPRDRDPRAAYLLIDTEKDIWKHMRVEYSIDDAAARIKEESLPPVLWQRLYSGI